MAKLTFPISGMTCTACQSYLEKTIQKLPGVTSASVNLMLHNATVDFAPTQIEAEQLVAAVRAAGYDSALPAVDQSVLDQHEQESHQAHLTYRSLVIKAIFALLAGFIAMFASMPLMTHHAALDPVSSWAMNAVDPFVRQFFPVIFRFSTQTLTWSLLTLTTIVIAFAGGDFYRRAWSGLQHRTADMNLLIATGTGAAYLYSLVSTVFPQWLNNYGLRPEFYFEAVIFILALVLTGRAIELRAKTSTTSALQKLVALQPTTATVVRDMREIVLPIASLILGDQVIVKPGERIAVDGTVLDGFSEVDESMLTGESLPVTKQIGSIVLAGTMNQSGALTIKATKLGAENAVAQIVRLLRDAQASRAPIQHLADRVSAVFVPLILIVALGVFVVWCWSGNPGQGLSSAVAVLIIACPCAMGLAIPAATMVATGSAASVGVLFKNGQAIESLAQVNAIVFDKTGTLTLGKPTLVESTLTAQHLQWAASVEAKSEHPIAAAVVEFARRQNLPLLPVIDFKITPGMGAAGDVSGHEITIGNARLIDVPPQSLLAAEDGLSTIIFVGVDRDFVGWLKLRDTLRPDSAAAVRALAGKELRLVMLTGDRAAIAQQVAAEVGVNQVIAEVLPEGKRSEVQQMQQAGFRVAMIGDGVNDAPSLAQANVGIAMGSGSDIAIEAADIVLIRPNLMRVKQGFEIAQSALRIMRQNLFWAFAYNVVGIPLAAGVLVPHWGFALSPVFASLAMAFSSVSVVLNSLRLKAVATSGTTQVTEPR
jgi:P-type Cu+ transporter